MALASRLNIGLLLYPGCMPAGLFAFADLAHAANLRSGRQVFDPIFVALGPGPVTCAHGHVLTPAATLEHTALDAVLIPGGWASSTGQVEQALADNAALVHALSRLGKGVMMLSYCTGVCLLAATGRLNGHQATVAWWLSDLMRARHPKVSWTIEQASIFNQHTASASGVNGHQPLAQELVARHIGREAFRDITKLMVLPRPEHTHQAFRAMDLIDQGDAFLRKLYVATQGLPASSVTVSKLAAALRTTERTLARKVSAATGMPVASFLRRIKLHQVSERLILSSAPASAVSAALGFSSDSSMRRMFKELTGMTPTEYRAAYRRP